MPAHHAAPALQLAWVVCAPAHADFDAAAAAPMLALSELTVRFTLQTLNIFADAIDSLKVFDRIYKRSDDYFDALERALPAAPSPSPFLVATANLEEPGFRPPGRAGGSCRCCCCGGRCGGSSTSSAGGGAARTAGLRAGCARGARGDGSSSGAGSHGGWCGASEHAVGAFMVGSTATRPPAGARLGLPLPALSSPGLSRA